jgi:hypothetical protein
MNEQDLCCLVDPDALDPEVRSLGEHLAVSRNALIALPHPMRQELHQVLARAELNVGEIVAATHPRRPRAVGGTAQKSLQGDTLSIRNCVVVEAEFARDRCRQNRCAYRVSVRQSSSQIGGEPDGTEQLDDAQTAQASIERHVVKVRQRQGVAQRLVGARAACPGYLPIVGAPV